MDILRIKYTFRFSDGSEKVFSEQFKGDTLAPIGRKPSRPPEWAALEFHQCSNCPLSGKNTPYCPVATDLVKLLDDCRGMDPLDTVNLEVATSDRVISLSTTVQHGVGSLLGLVIATSDCPHAKFFRPMARFHLPLASETESIYRVVSMYMMAQYMRQLEGDEFEVSIEGLNEIYRNLEVVNTSIAGRLKAAGGDSAGVKPIMEWDVFSGMFPMRAEEVMDKIRPLFSAYLADR